MSKTYSIDWKDILNGAITAVLGSVLVLAYQMLQTGNYDLKQLGFAALSAFVGYLAKRFVSDENGITFGNNSNVVVNQ